MFIHREEESHDEQHRILCGIKRIAAQPERMQHNGVFRSHDGDRQVAV